MIQQLPVAKLARIMHKFSTAAAKKNVKYSDIFEWNCAHAGWHKMHKDTELQPHHSTTAQPQVVPKEQKTKNKRTRTRKNESPHEQNTLL
ncbi:hypothetical protein MYX82_06100 [Acidobacteria bacterium AH-259-D05]|nr:hypothetical protein [Acidobacteria bacterium AH-259-D05]